MDSRQGVMQESEFGFEFILRVHHQNAIMATAVQGATGPGSRVRDMPVWTEAPFPGHLMPCPV